MKSAEVEDAWRHLRSNTKRGLASISMRWAGIDRLTDGSIRIRHQFSIVCGENGVGKSTLLHLLFNALVPASRRNEGAVMVREDFGMIEHLGVELGLRLANPAFSLIDVDGARDHFAADDALRVRLFDPAVYLPAVLGLIHSDANFQEYLEQFGSREYDPNELADASYLVGKDYERIEVVEVDGLGNFGVFPYFWATTDGRRFGSESMGFGELSLLLMHWILCRMPKSSVLLLEEPETFVAPKSQRRLTNIAARTAVERDLLILATTHSPSVASQFLREEMTYVSRAGNVVSIHSPPPSGVVDRRLELVPARRVLWIVEDALASRTLEYFLNLAELSEISDILIVGDNTNVKTITGRGKPVGRKFVFHGIVDGDERERGVVATAVLDILPGSVRPEALIRAYVKGTSVGILSEVLKVPADQIAIAKASSAGNNDHQWLHDFRAELGLTLEDLIPRLLSGWANENVETTTQFVESLKTAAAKPTV